jgi:hypothetical protein
MYLYMQACIYELSLYYYSYFLMVFSYINVFVILSSLQFLENLNTDNNLGTIINDKNAR